MTRTIANATDARELALFAVNEGTLYTRRAQPIMANLRRKIAKGTYDATLAIKAWAYLADDAAKLYAKEYGGNFNKATREAAAAEIAAHYEDELRAA